MQMKPILLDLPMSITTERLILRPPQPGDGPELNAAIIESFDDLNRWMPWAKTRPSVDESEEIVRRAYARWILREEFQISIFDRTTGKLAGSTGLHRINWDVPSFEIGYWARTSFAGKGYITESTNALTRFAFQFLKAKRVEIRCDSTNQKSIAVAKRLGFELEGCLRNGGTSTNGTGPRDTSVFSLLTDAALPPLKVSW